jgi:serine phosphatase RsbU (regulator of sigma subunit)
MFFGIVDDQGHLEYINAGHPSPFLIRNGVAEDVFTEGSYPVGLVPEAEYTTVCLKLDPGDTLVLFSDGVTEAMDPAEQLFGVPRLKEVLMGEGTQTPLDELQRKVLDAVENFAHGASQADDLTLLLVRYRGALVVSDTDVPPIQASSASAA